MTLSEQQRMADTVTPSGPRPYLAILALTAMLERFLGDVVYTMALRGPKRGSTVGNAILSDQSKGAAAARVPFLMTDLLTLPELRDVLGPSLVSLLRLLAGPPLALNLRNVTWHGFALEDSFCASPSCALWADVVLLAVVTSLNRAKEYFGSGGMDARSGVSLCRYYPGCSRLDLDGRLFVHRFSSSAQPPTPPDLTPASASFLTYIFKTSTFCSPAFTYAWSALPSLYSRLDGPWSKYGFLLVALPLLEAELRWTYVTVNSLPVERVATAHQEVYYTTLDTILVEAECANAEGTERPGWGNLCTPCSSTFFTIRVGQGFGIACLMGFCGSMTRQGRMIRWTKGITALCVRKCALGRWRSW
ncbi:hypothetical protein M427DRAFT_56818 [Gonapodya prolifera JEL478]|uniref:DUF4209 domain-containing protein n=1 Tax=Gonapodya prolifera (strain JEL478) TaxID=1344416 RepID=A0A139AF87_GONPJ|nr:hypothetical protein M427DRAFT_56818 [Gonapodya prolifera JEL478]|eukprot:KXS15476.1 hypothetical protein M427DRAFT_56818 [Gonapodya prolifera JEL478]